MHLKELWEYQQVDIEYNRFETEMRNDPDRLQLLKHRKEWEDQQKAIERVESDVAVIADRLEAVEDEYKRLSAQLAEQKEKYEQLPPDDLEAAAEALKQVNRTLELLSRYEDELKKLSHDAEARNRQQREIRVCAARIREEYTRLKTEYDRKFQPQKQKLDELRARVEREASHVDPQLLRRYREIAKHCFPPMARLNGDKCVGCNMSLPSGVMRDLRAGDRLVECDNCGRIIYIPDEESGSAE